jgi:hypothetical protein
MIFVTGAAIGSFVTCKVLEAKYNRIIDEEVQSVKEAYRNANSEQQNSGDTEEPVANDQDEGQMTVTDYESVLLDEGYVDYSSIENGRKGVRGVKKPYVIPPNEFGECDGYDEISLVYYADGVLTDDNDVPVEDVDRTVGVDSLTHFGEYEDDSVHVRNDELKADFEILRDLRNYADVVNRPRPTDSE